MSYATWLNSRGDVCSMGYGADPFALQNHTRSVWDEIFGSCGYLSRPSESERRKAKNRQRVAAHFDRLNAQGIALGGK